MTGGTKVINRSLTIISLMVMIAAGSLIMRIPEASALDVVTFTLVPTDGDTQYTVYNCEAIVRRYSNPQEYSVFQAELDGTIPIDTSQLSWEFSYDDSEVEIAVSDNQNAYEFEDRWFDLTGSIEGVQMMICGFDKNSLPLIDDKDFTCHGGPYDSVYDTGQLGMPVNGFTYAGTQGEAYFVCTYHAHLTASKHLKGEQWRMVISDFYFEAYNWVQNEKGSRIDRQNRGYEVILAISNPIDGYDSDDHFDPQFTIKFTRGNQPITNAYYFVWGAQWELQQWMNQDQEWETMFTYDEFDDCLIASTP